MCVTEYDSYSECLCSTTLFLLKCVDNSAGMSALHNRQYPGRERVHPRHRQGLVASPGSAINASPSPTDLKPPPQTNSHLRPLTPKYTAKNVGFEYVRDVPSDLLGGVALCFQFHQVVCRQCFLLGSGCRQVTTTKKSSSTCIEGGHPWRPLLIMPSCRLCSNTIHSMHIPVLPFPKHLKDSAAPLCVCGKTDHQQCYSLVSKTTSLVSAHSVEELVIWTVERERCESTHHLVRQ